MKKRVIAIFAAILTAATTVSFSVGATEANSPISENPFIGERLSEEYVECQPLVQLSLKMNLNRNVQTRQLQIEN